MIFRPSFPFTSMLALLLLGFLVSCKPNICQEKAHFLNEVESLLAKSAAQKDSKTKDWASFDQDMEVLFSKCYPTYKSELTADEQSTFLTMAADIYYNRYFGDITTIKTAMQKGFKENFEVDLTETSNEVSNAINERVVGTFREEFKLKVQNFAKEARLEGTEETKEDESALK